MGYRLTTDEVKSFQDALKGASYQVEGLDVWFTTTTEFLAEVLPPCFTVPDEPIGYVQFSTGAGAGMDFYSAVIYVAAKFGEIDGFYDLSMLLTGDMTVILGRELWGESKKRASFGYTPGPERPSYYVERGGVKVIQVSGEFGEDLGPRRTVRNGLHLKTILNADATDLHADPIVFVLECTADYDAYYEGKVDLELTSSPGDHCGSVPIVSVDKATFGVRSAVYESSRHPIEGREGYLPYAIGRSYDLFT